MRPPYGELTKRQPTIAAMPQVFDALLAKGFKFVTVSELLAMDKGGERKPLK
jgi:hypothetical protein